jgi:N-acetylneuraminate synthase
MRRRPFIVAELSGNHNQSLNRALELVAVAESCGADAVKLQTFKPEQMAPADYVVMKGPWAGSNLRELYRETCMPWEWHKEIFDYAREIGITCFSTPFSKEAVDFLETLYCPIYKISSFEIIDLDLIAYVASKGKPIFISTGMATYREIDSAVRTSRPCKLTILKCTSAYPSNASEANLSTILDMKEWSAFRLCDVGLSDHTLGIGVSVAAVALGASVIEKHLTLSRADGGPDSSFSMEPHEFRQLVEECRRAYEALGEVRYGPTSSEQDHIELRHIRYEARRRA